MTLLAPFGRLFRAATPWALALILVAAAALPAAAQDRSETGRRKPQRTAPAEPVRPQPAAADQAAPMLADDPDRWVAGIGLGLGDAGDLFRVETLTGAVAAWGPAGDPRFRASRFTATVDPGADLSAHLARRLGRGRWWLRGEVSRSAADVAAEALLGQGGDVFFYDRVTFLTFGLGLEARLTSWPSHPYAVLAVSACHMSASRYDDLSETGFGGRFGLGYRHRIGKAFLGLEAGMARISMDYGDFRPPIAEAPEPVFSYAPVDDLWRVDVRVVASRRW
jgi:hypothetical protein